METGLIKYGKVELTPSGSLYMEKLADTLHRVIKYKLSLTDGTSRELTFKEFCAVSDGLTQTNAKFVKLANGELIAVSIIRSVKPYEVIVDTRKERL